MPLSTPLPPTATFVPGCGAALTLSDATKLVLEIYPNTSIVSAQEVTRFDDRLVWEITTSHGIEVTIDVGCGYILTIERNNSGQANTNSANSNDEDNLDSDTNTSSNSNISPDFNQTINDNSDDGSENNNDNSNDNEDDNSGMGSDDGGDDNSGMG